MHDNSGSIAVSGQKTALKKKPLAGLRNIILLTILISVLVTVVWAVPLQRVSYAQQQAAREYDLKAVYLYNFLQFVQWPESKRTAAKDGTMVIGILGESPFGDALSDLQADVRKSGMKPIKIVYFGDYEADMDLTACNLLFVSLSAKDSFRKIVSSLRGAPVLTVAESENFLSSGGMISLVHINGKIRWSINRAAAERVGLRFSSQLLNMAVKVVEAN